MDNADKEIFLMKLSAGLTVVFGVAGLAVALMTDSMSVLLDALYGIVDMLISIAAIFVVLKIHSPPDRNYHFGYAKLEPLMSGINGTLIIALCICTIFTSVQDIVHSDPVCYPGLIVGYSLVSFIVCLFFAVYMRTCGKRWRSEIVVVDSHLWMTEAIISAAICVSFGIGLLMARKPGWEEYSCLADPVTCILLSLFLLIQPLRIIWGSFQDMVDACPPDEVRTRISGLVDGLRGEYNFNSVESLRLRKAGRRLFLTICFNTAGELSIREMSSVRQEIIDRMKSVEPEVDMCILFNNGKS